MSDHEISYTNLMPDAKTISGKTAWCKCGWSDTWRIADGSAEASASGHMVDNDPEYRAQREAWGREWAQEQAARGCICEHFWDGSGFMLDRECPLHGSKNKSPANRYASESNAQRCHDCSCHIDPPCTECVECVHIDVADGECESDCQECPGHGEIVRDRAVAS